jgi:FKBP-type peptidyl-prolyl cis-trans isomerase
VKLQIFNGSRIRLFILTTCFVLISCGSSTVEMNKPHKDKSGETMIRVNKIMVENDVELIKAYIKRHDWQMKETESGLWYEVFKKGNGMKIKHGMEVSMRCKLELLDGTVCNISDSIKIKNVKAGLGKVEAGLDEGILLMQFGDCARFILPPHLAYGLSGDNKCIPPRSIIVYTIEIINVN